jgi:hypothetical protein
MKNLVGKPGGRRCRWQDSTKLGLHEGVDWIHLAQDRNHWRSSDHGNEHLGSIKGGEFLD